MNVTYYNRPKMKGGFSEEAVFRIIKNELEDKIQIRNYYCSSKWARTRSLLDVAKYQGDVNHITGDVFHLALALNKNKTILTVHDIRHYEQDLSRLKKNMFGLLFHRLPFLKAKAITTISNCTKEKIVDEFSVSKDKIRVIYNPAPSDFSFHKKTWNTENPTILQIGSAPHKNLNRLIDAIDVLNFRLLLIRKKDNVIQRLLEKKGIDYSWFEYISRQEVYECYKKSDIVFFASEYEGFGVPILEANAVGRPVVTSNISSMPEVAGDSALLVDPYSVDEIRQALQKISSESNVRESLVEKGIHNLKRFEASKIAGQYLDLYKEIAR